MKVKHLLAVPLVALTIGAGGAAAFATPNSTDPWATLPQNPPGTDPQPRSMVLFDGNVFVANSQASTVTKILPNGTVDTSFNATLPTGADPIGIAADSAGNLYTADAGTFAVSKITPAGTVTAAYAALSALNAPQAITVDPSDNVFTANNDSTISRITPAGKLDAGYANLGSVGPIAIASDAHGTLYTANQGDGTIGRIVQGAPPSVTPDFVHLGTALPSAIALTSSGTIAYVSNEDADTVSKLDLSGSTNGSVVDVYTLPAGSMSQGIAVDEAGNAYTSDFGIAKVSMVTSDQADRTAATTIQTLSDPGADPQAIVVDSSGRLLTAGFNSGTVSKLELAPVITSNADLDSIVSGAPFSYTATATGVDPLSFSLTGTIPAGLTFDASTGVLSGLPTQSGTFALVLSATNPFGTSKSVPLTLDITAAPGGGTGGTGGSGAGMGMGGSTPPGHLPTVAG